MTVEDTTQVDMTDAGNNSEEKPAIAENILEELGFESIDDAKALIEKSRELDDKLGDSDVDELLKRNQKFSEMEQAWALEDELKKEKEESEPDTIKRLKDERDQARKLLTANSQLEQQHKEAQALITRFDTIVSTTVDSAKLPDPVKEFASKWFGAESPVASVALEDGKASKQMVKMGIKDLNTLSENIVQAYVDGKLKIPKIGKTEPAAGVTTPGDKKPIKMKDAVKASLERLRELGFS